MACLLIDQDSFEFVPARAVDRVLMPNVETYIDQGICGEAFTAGKPTFIFDKRKYSFKSEEALILFPLIFSGVNYGIIIIVTTQDECKRVLNESRDDINTVYLIVSKFIEMYDKYEMQQKKYTQAKETSARLTNLLESVAHGILMLDSNNIISFFNRNAEVMFGMIASDVIGKSYREVFPERLTRSFDVLVQNTIIEGTIFDHEIEIELVPNVKIPVGISTSLIRDASGETKGIVCISRDMTLTKEVNRLKEIDKMKSEFVSMVSHELKNPIAVIKSTVETLLAIKKMGKDFGPEFEVDSMKTINGEIDRLAEIINDLLSLSRIESGNIEINKQLVMIDAFLAETTRIFKVSEETHPIVIKNEATEPVPFDPDKVKQVVINYVNNAIKYSPNGSDVVISTKIENNKFTLAVEDKGLGIPEDALPKVFDKFYRVSTSETAKISGTGLGLQICKKIIELHHGKVWVTSVHGEGSVFGFDLPMKASKSDKEEATES